VVSGDTRKSANLAKFAEGGDLLVHEALSTRLVALIGSAAAEAGRDNIAKITTDIVDYHTTPVEAAEIARDADVGALLYYHIVPPLPLAPLEDVFLEGVDEVYRGPVYVGRDGTLLSLPAGSEAIEHRELL
jgi:ribonuclease Z